jgi:hypothetical protein
MARCEAKDAMEMSAKPLLRLWVAGISAPWRNLALLTRRLELAIACGFRKDTRGAHKRIVRIRLLLNGNMGTREGIFKRVAPLVGVTNLLRVQYNEVI